MRQRTTGLAIQSNVRLILFALVCLFTMSCGEGRDAVASYEHKLAQSRDVAAKIVYRVTFEGAFRELNSTTIVATKPPDRRVDITYDSGDTDVFGIFQGELVECHNGKCADVIEDRQAVLDRLSVIDTSIAISEDFDVAASDADASVGSLPARTVAGLAAECFEVAGSGTIVETCFAADSGLLLLQDTKNVERGHRMTIVATSVDTTVRVEDVSHLSDRR